MTKLDSLAAKADEVEAALDDQALSEIADLVLRLHQRAAREAGAILPPHMMRSYSERRESEREGMRAAVKHVVVALVLLGVVDPPAY